MLRTLLCAVALFIISVSAYAQVEVSPKICRADIAQDLAFQIDSSTTAPLDKLRVLYIREDGTRTDGVTVGGIGMWQVITPRYDTETMTLRTNGLLLRGEGLHSFRVVVTNPEQKQPNNWEVVGKAEVYTLQEDLFALHPYRGDFHSHSMESDGKGTSTSVYAHARRNGLDFATLTDHRKLWPATKAAAVINRMKSGMLAMAGEEFHYDGSPLHSISVGGTDAINDWAKAKPAIIKQRIKDKRTEIAQGTLSDTDYNALVVAETMYDLARNECGSQLVIFAHPYWKPNERFHAPTGYVRAMLDRHKFDAVETPNGFGDAEFALMTFADALRLALEQNYEMAFVNVTDTHDASTFDFAASSTIVFAKELTTEAVCNAVKNRMSVATVGKYDPKTDTKPLHIGRERLVRYAYFLTRNYYPGRDDLCRQQGELMLKVLDGDTATETADKITQLRANLNSYDRKARSK